MIRYLKRYWILMILAPLFMLGEIAAELWQPAMMAVIVDDGILKGDVQIIITEGFRMLGLVIGGGICGILCNLAANAAGQKFGNDLRKNLFENIMDFSFEQTDRFTTGSLIIRLTNDVSQVVHMVMMSVRSLIRCLAMFIGGIFMLRSLNGQFAWIAALGLPLVACMVMYTLRKVTPLYAEIQQKMDRMTCIMQENISGIRVVKAYVKEEHELSKFSKANDALCRTSLQAQIGMAFMHPVVNLILNGCIVAALWAGAQSVRSGTGIQPGEIMAATTYMTMILMRIVFLANIFQTFTRAGASWKRIREVLDTKSSQFFPEQTPEITSKGKLEFNYVCFAYPDAPKTPVLENISFSVEAGQTLALIGATGSGKTSLVSLINRFYDVTDGKIFINDVDIKEYSKTSLRKRVGMVCQRAELFSRSIKENIEWGRKKAEGADLADCAAAGSGCSDQEDLHQSARIAQAEEFILQKPDQYETQVSERGHSLSGGQKQRVSVARALIRKPEILILDDASSALDLKTEKAMMTALNESSDYRQTTKIIVAQRISSVMHADKILVLEDGKIAGQGTHAELLADCQLYQEIYHSQRKEGMEYDGAGAENLIWGSSETGPQY